MHNFDSFRPQQRFARLDVYQDIAGVLVIGGGLHSRHLHFAGGINAVIVEPLQLRQRSDFMPPHIGEVWLAVKRTQCWGGQIRLAVARAGYSRCGKVQPLRLRARRENREQEKQPLMSHLAILAVGAAMSYKEPKHSGRKAHEPADECQLIAKQ
jgi:hypothetical protein